MSKLLTQIPVRHFVDEASRQDKDGWAIKTQVFTIRHTDTEQSRDNNKNGFDDWRQHTNCKNQRDLKINMELKETKNCL